MAFDEVESLSPFANICLKSWFDYAGFVGFLIVCYVILIGKCLVFVSPDSDSFVVDVADNDVLFDVVD